MIEEPAKLENAAGANLLITFEEVCHRLRRCAAEAIRGDDAAVFDSFLYAAGLGQMLEDYLDRDVLQLTRAAPHLEGLGGPVARAAARAAAGTGNMAVGIRGRLRRARRLEEQQQRLARFVYLLAQAVAAGVLGEEGDNAGSPIELASLQQQVDRVVGESSCWPTRLLASLLRLPNCFHSLDQEPGDCLRLVEGFATRWPDRDRHLLVVGLRTSGSYLAPLTAAFLQARGYGKVEWLTIRDGRPLGRVQAALAAHAAAGAVGLVVDDAPRTGRQLGLAAKLLEDHGVTAVVLVQQLPVGRAGLDPRTPTNCVVLPWEAWGIHTRMQANAIRNLLDEAGRRSSSYGEPTLPCVLELTQTAVHAPNRGHVRATYAARVRHPVTGAESPLTLCAEGVGLGWFGRQAEIVAQRLDGLVPAVYGAGRGVFVRAWMDEAARLTPERVASDPVATAKLIARYVAARRDRLALNEDLTFRAMGTDTAWIRTGRDLGEIFGRAQLFLRPLTDRLARRLLSAVSPAVIDGAVVPSSWFGDEHQSAVKADFYGGSLRTNRLASCDPVLDLAQAAAQSDGNDGLARILRDEYEELLGERIGDERWFLSTLAHLRWAYETQLKDVARARNDQAGFDMVLANERKMADALRAYLGPLFFADLWPLASGPLCAVDIDGVLETRWCDFPAIGPAGASALRRLHRHGFRVLLASGRSLDEVRARCKAFRLPGGVAEYGSVVYVSRNDKVETTVSADGEAALRHVRKVLHATDGVYVDPVYRSCVRAHALTRDALRHGLTREAAQRVVDNAGVAQQVSVVAGELQTDFVATGVDKGTGLAALARMLGEPVDAGPLLRFAVGDAEPDIAMFRVAAKSYAPAGSSPAALVDAVAMRSPGPAGLAEAVTREVGHRRCHQCAARPLQDGDADLMLTLLGAMGCSRVARVGRAVALAGKLMGLPASTRGRRSPS